VIEQVEEIRAEAQILFRNLEDLLQSCRIHPSYPAASELLLNWRNRGDCQPNSRFEEAGESLKGFILRLYGFFLGGKYFFSTEATTT
jgi:hypothetical protein